MEPDRLHKTKHIKFKDIEADIDQDIADLILDLWKLDIGTTNSCQDNVPKGFVWIEFQTAYDAELFLNYVAEYSGDLDSVYQRLAHRWRDDKPRALWRYNVNVMDEGIHQELDDNGDVVNETCDHHDFHFAISVRFPRTDLQYVKRRLREAAARVGRRALLQ
jgi:hypothetical protein